MYNVVLRTLWWSKNFHERFIGIDDPSRGTYKWQHNAPPIEYKLFENIKPKEEKNRLALLSTEEEQRS